MFTPYILTQMLVFDILGMRLFFLTGVFMNNFDQLKSFWFYL